MGIQDFVPLAVLAVVDVVIVLVCWLVALRSGNQRYKQIAGIVGFCGFALIGMQAYVLYEKNAPRPDFVTDAVGPARGTGGVTRDVMFQVMESGETHRVELTARAQAEEPAKGKINLYYKLTDAQGKTLAEAEQSVEAATGGLWSPVQFTFVPEMAGVINLSLRIPAGVDAVHVVAKDPR